MKNTRTLILTLIISIILIFLGTSYFNSQYKLIDRLVFKFHLNKINNNPFVGKWRLSGDIDLSDFYPDNNLYITFQNDNIIIIQNEEGEASTSYTFEDNILKIGSTTTEGNAYEFSDKDNFSLLIVHPDGEESTSYFKRVP